MLQLETMAADRRIICEAGSWAELHPDSVALLRGGLRPRYCCCGWSFGPGVERNAIPLLHELLPLLLSAGWTIGPLTLVRHGRVAVGDAIGALLGARLSLVLIGERPGFFAGEPWSLYYVGPCAESDGCGPELRFEYLCGWAFGGCGCGEDLLVFKEGRVRELPESG